MTSTPNGPIDFYQVDAFTDRLFRGNPAAVCPLKAWLPDDVLQAMTNEHNQSETAFFVPIDNGFELRWFTSLGEIELCGHATLASAHVIFHHLHHAEPEVRFTTRMAGPLTVRRGENNWLTLDFPVLPPKPGADLPKTIVTSLGGLRPQQVLEGHSLMLVFADEQDVRTADPDFKILAQVSSRICITAPGTNCDFVSRYFCPGAAVEEDPVTGSAHCMLVPYWAERLGKKKLFARQLSRRGGELHCELCHDRVLITGQAQTYMKGQICLETRS